MTAARTLEYIGYFEELLGQVQADEETKETFALLLGGIIEGFEGEISRCKADLVGPAFNMARGH